MSSKFFLPFGILISIAVGTFLWTGTPTIRWAFGAAVLIAFVTTMLRGMSLRCLIEGFGDGLKGVVMGSVILVLAITIGGIGREAGGGIFWSKNVRQDRSFADACDASNHHHDHLVFDGYKLGNLCRHLSACDALAWAVAQSQGLAQPG